MSGPTETTTTAPTAVRVVDVKRGSLDDGPGLRTVVFFKGCPLRCAWCQNPETFSPQAELQVVPDRCTGCGACVPACPAGVARPGAPPQPAAGEDGVRAGEGCRRCGRCVDACPAAARRVVGEAVEPEALVARLLRDRIFWRRSGGGVTLSGGEPTLHARHAGRVAALLRAEGVHVLLETCGLFRWEEFAAQLLPHLSAVYCDVKLADPAAHRRWTGAGCAPIHANLARLAAQQASGLQLLPRLPLVPGVTDTEANLRAVAELCLGLGLRRLALLPYNPLWLDKRRALGLPPAYTHDGWMPPTEVARCRQVVEQAGVEVV